MLNPRGFVKLLATRAIGQGCKDGQFFFYWIYILLLLDYFSGMKNVDDEKGESRESGLSHFSCYSRSVLRAPSVSILLPSLLFYFSMMTITTFSTKWNGFFEGKKKVKQQNIETNNNGVKGPDQTDSFVFWWLLIVCRLSNKWDAVSFCLIILSLYYSFDVVVESLFLACAFSADWRVFLFFSSSFFSPVFYIFLSLETCLDSRPEIGETAWRVQSKRSCHLALGSRTSNANRTSPTIPRHPGTIATVCRSLHQHCRKSKFNIFLWYLFFLFFFFLVIIII